jgi:carbon monoxide dehydrogenase subunit G
MNTATPGTSGSFIRWRSATEDTKPMQVKLEKRFPLSVRPDTAWTMLQDIRAVAQCMPGAEITERVDETHYKGRLRVRLGPAAVAFNGDLEVLLMDPGSRELKLRGKGVDVKGTSTASMDLTTRVDDGAEGGSELTGTSEIAVSGKVASFGGRLITQVSDQLMEQFVANFNNRVVAAGGGERAAEAEVEAQPTALNAGALFFRALWNLIKSLFRRGSNA